MTWIPTGPCHVDPATSGNLAYQENTMDMQGHMVVSGVCRFCARRLTQMLKPLMIDDAPPLCSSKCVLHAICECTPCLESAVITWGLA
jgi:hypothetical protein